MGFEIGEISYIPGELNVITRVLINRWQENREQTRDITMEAKIGLMKPQTKEYWQPLEAERGQEKIPSWSIGGNSVCILIFTL